MVESKNEQQGQIEEVTLKTIRDEIKCQGTIISYEMRRMKLSQERLTMMSILIATSVALFVGGAVIGGETKAGLILMVFGGLLMTYTYVVVSLNRSRQKA